MNARALSLSFARAGPEALSAAVALFLAFYVAGSRLRDGFAIDDAWIHFTYALAVRRGEGFAYNTGIAATGCTSPLWVLFGAAAHFLAGAREPSVEAATILKLIGAALFATSAVLGARLARACAPRRRDEPMAGLAAGLLVATIPILLYASVSGMEIPLAGCLLLATLLAAVRRRWLAAGTLAGLAFLARPEAILVVPLVLGLAWLDRTGAVSLPRRLAASGAALVFVAVDLCRNAWVSGRPLPATFYRKSHFHVGTLVGDLRAGFRDILGSYAPTSFALFWVLVALSIACGGVAAVRARGRPRSQFLRRRLVGGAAALLGVAYVAGISSIAHLRGGEIFYFERYVLPPVPLLVVGAVSAAQRASALRLPAAWGQGAKGWVARALRLFVPLALAVCLAVQTTTWSHTKTRYDVHVAGTDATEVALGLFVRELPAGAVVWSQDAGAIRYFGRHPTVDLNELNTAELFRGEPMPRAWWPDAIIVSPVAFTVVASPGALEQAFDVHPPSDPENPLGIQVVLRCRGQEGTVGVDRHGKRVADGRCARAEELR
jgi:hypothetical protein